MNSALHTPHSAMVRSGYKQTEVGVIPADWDVKNFGQICRVNQGLQIAIERRLKHPTPTAKTYITIQYLNDSKQAEYIDDYPLSACCSPGDVLMTRTGNTGIVVSGVEGAFHNNFFKINFDKKVLIREFLIGFLGLSSTRRTILIKAGTSTIPDLNHGDFYSILLPIPALPEQRAIAEALSDVDGLLAGLDRLIAKKRDLKQAAMQQLLTGQTRLPGFRGEWEHVRLGELFSFKSGLNKAKEFFGFGTPIVNYMDVFGSPVIRAKQLEGRVSLSRAELKNFDVQKGDVFFTRTSETAEEIGIASVMLDESADTVFSGFVLRARPLNKRLNHAFKAYCFSSAAVRKQITSKASYTTRALTNGRILAQVLLRLPTISEQIAIAELLTEMDLELAALERRRDKTRALKQAMMQELLTGRTRLI